MATAEMYQVIQSLLRQWACGYKSFTTCRAQQNLAAAAALRNELVSSHYWRFLRLVDLLAAQIPQPQGGTCFCFPVRPKPMLIIHILLH